MNWLIWIIFGSVVLYVLPQIELKNQLKENSTYTIGIIAGKSKVADSNPFGIGGSSDTSTHFYSIIEKSQYDTLSGTDFTWAIFKPINDSISLMTHPCKLS